MILNQILQFSVVYYMLYHLSYKKTVKTGYNPYSCSCICLCIFL